MIWREPSFYKSFLCAAGDCPLTCCRDWSIVPDDDALADYKAAPQPLRDTIAANLTADEDGDVCFRLTDDGRCALLDGDGLCAIQRGWGEEHLCAHCAAYPRFIEEYGCLIESSLAVSCPEAARLTMSRGILPLSEGDDGAEAIPFDGVDAPLLDALTISRATAFKLAADPERPLWSRLAMVLDYAAGVQRSMDRGDGARAVLCPVPAPREPEAPAGRKDRAVRLLALLTGLDPLRPQWPALLRRRAGELSALSPEGYAELEAAYAAARPGWDLRLTRLCQALLFRHWPKAVNDGVLYGRAAFAAAACFAVYHLALLSWREDDTFGDGDEALLWARFSREVEHDDGNFFTVTDLFQNTLDNGGLLL